MKKLFNTIGNIAHVFINFSFLYAIGYGTKVPTFTWEGKYIAYPIAAAIIAVGVCHGWNYVKATKFGIKKKNNSNYYQSAIGAILGAYFVTIVPQSDFITYYCTIVSIVFTIYYIWLMNKNKGK